MAYKKRYFDISTEAKSLSLWTIMSKQTLSILLCMAFTMPFFTGCKPMSKVPTEDNDALLARVGAVELKASDVKGLYTQAISEEDSVKLLNSYVNTWVRKQVKIQEAERVLESSGVDIESMVNDYRNSLLTHKLDQYYVEKYLDDEIPQEVVESYYAAHKSEFLLDRAIVKGRIVRVPNSYRQQAKLKELMGSPNAARQQDFIDICAKNSFELTEFDSWVDFREFLAYLPVTRGQNYSRMTTQRKVQEMADDQYRYYIQITESLKKGDRAPLEWVEHIVKRIIHNQKSSEVIRRSEDSLYNAAVAAGKIEINL